MLNTFVYQTSTAVDLHLTHKLQYQDGSNTDLNHSLNRAGLRRKFKIKCFFLEYWECNLLNKINLLLKN